MARVEGGAVIIDTDWPSLKNQIDTRNINFKYEEDSSAYEIFAIDGQYFYKTIIYKAGEAPQNQATYDTWRAEFEGTYKNRITDFNSTQPYYLSTVDGYSVVLKDGAAPTANDGYGIAIIGYDGSNYRMSRMDSTGRQILVGAGTAGSPAGGVISIQGVPSGTAMPVSGTVSISGSVTTTVSGTVAATQSGTWTVQPGNTANTTPWLITINQGGNSATVTASNALKVDGSAVTQPVSGTVTANAGTGTFTVAGTVTANAGTGNFTNASIGSTGSAVPASASYAGFSDGTNLQGARVFDVDTGGGTQYVQGVNLRLSAGGGSVEFGTNTNPIRIDPTGTTTQPISGTVTANIGTAGTLALEATQVKLTIAQGTALGSNTQVLIGGSVTTAAPTYTTGNINPFSLTTAGALRIDGSATTQPISGTVTANAGTGNFTVVQSTAANLRSQTSSESNTGSAVPTQASMVGGSDGTNLRAIFLDSSGRQIVIGAAASGAAVAGNPVLVAGSDGTNARSIRTATDGTVRVDPTGTTTQPVSGTVAATQSGAWTVTANAGTGNFIVVGTATDNTTNSTAKLPVMAAVATTGAPTYTTGNMVPLSVDTSGNLRITGSISATNPSVGTNNAAIPTSSTQIGGSDGTNLQASRVFDLDTGGGTQFVLGVGLRKAASGGSVELGTSSDPIRIDPTGTTTQPVSGTVTVTQGTAANLRAQTASEFTTAAATGTIATLTGGAVTTAAPTYTTGQMNPLSLTTTGLLRIDGSGVTQPISGTVAATQSGTWTVQPGNTANTTPWLATISQGGNAATVTASNALKVDGSAVTQPVSGTVTSNQGTANTLANRWPVIITDGTNTMPTADTVARSSFHRITDGTNTTAVKAASTAAVAADPALVVSVSPNTAITVGVSQQDLTGSGALGALNATVQLGLAGTAGVGMQLAAGTLVGTIVPEISNDGGTTWVSGQFFDPITGVLASSIVFGVSNTAQTKTIIISGGVSHVRVRVSAYTSGTANCALRATTANDPSTAIRGTDGSILRTILLDSLGRIVTAPAGSAASNGIAVGTVSTAATTNVAIRQTTYTEPASNAQRSVSSANAADTSAGTGARQVTITYYDSTGAGPFTTTVTMNGVTAVATGVSNICFIEKIEVTSVGSGGVNAGIITLFVNNAGGGGTIGTIAAGDNKTLWAHHYVGSTVSCYITGLTGNNNNGSNGTILTIRSKAIGVANTPENQISDYFRVGGATAQSTRTYGTPIKVIGPARITIFAAPEGSPNIINRAGMDFYDQ